MKKFAERFSKPLLAISKIGVYACFAGMAYVCYEIIKNVIKSIQMPSATSGVALVLPIEADGILYVPFAYWIIGVLSVVIIHEAAHGIIAVLNKVKIRKTGLAVLGIFVPLIPAAFVEPDEKALAKKSRQKQLAVFGAGPFFNILAGLVLLPLFVFAANPFADSLYNHQGVRITGLSEGYDIFDSGIKEGDVITGIDSQKITQVADFKAYLGELRMGDIAHVQTEANAYDVVLGQNPENGSAYMGLFIEDKKELKDSGLFPRALAWLNGLLMWVVILNLGIGLFNLVPIAGLDGGRMFHIAMLGLARKRPAVLVHKIVSGCLLAIILGSVIVNFL